LHCKDHCKLSDFIQEVHLFAECKENILKDETKVMRKNGGKVKSLQKLFLQIVSKQPYRKSCEVQLDNISYGEGVMNIFLQHFLTFIKIILVDDNVLLVLTFSLGMYLFLVKDMISN